MSPSIIIQAIEDALQDAGGGPLMIREVAAKAGISRNTAGKYVAIAEALGKVRTDQYGVVRRVYLAVEGGRS